VEGFSSEKDYTRIRLEQPNDVLEQNALARTAEAYNGRDLPLIDLQVDALEDCSGVEPLGDALNSINGTSMGLRLQAFSTTLLVLLYFLNLVASGFLFVFGFAVRIYAGFPG